ncbi:ATP-binding protein [Streptomyces sulphureus]|uniref:ATP-binding protein n=1 Tax=Streptomyces sulphureus TaxID=47758 RepID=UPI000374D48A|nr:ATP-binding protein [Streptomyces sulphureus]
MEQEGGRFGGAGSAAGGGGPGKGPARIVQLVAGELLLTVNPVDGSEVEPCPPGMRPSSPTKLPAAERSAVPGQAGQSPLLEREEERSRLAGLLSCGRSVRVTGAPGSGRTALLDAVAGDVAGLPPDGVVRLSGHHRTARDLEHALYAAVYDAFGHRPEPSELHAALGRIGAIVLVDDLEFGQEALESLLSHTPECAFLLSALPGTPAPEPASHVEEVPLEGLSRTACLELLEHAVQRPLLDAEADWASGLWLSSEGNVRTFVQAGALLRLGGGGVPAEGPPARQVVAALPESAREVLRYALALEGEVPHYSHLPALTGSDDADDTLTDLRDAGLVSPVGGHFRLAAGVAEQLTEAGYAEGSGARALTAARHYGWWAGHPSVTHERVTAEADALLAALKGAQRDGAPSAAVLLARAAAPVLAAGLRWGDWERILRGGQEAARIAGEVAEEAYFHHELGVLALCTGQPERARAELEASIGLRGVLADQRGTVAGRRALALVADRLLAEAAGPADAAGEPSPASTPPTGVAFVAERIPPPAADHTAGAPTAGTRVNLSAGEAPESEKSQGPAPKGSRRNLVAAGAGAVLVAVLGTLVTLGSTAGDGDPDSVRPRQSTSQQEGDEQPAADDSPVEEQSDRSSRPVRPVESSTQDGGSDSPSTSASQPSEEDEDDRSSTKEAPSSSDDGGDSGGGGRPSSPKDPPTSPDDPTTSPDDPPSSPDDPPTSPDDPDPSAPEDDGPDSSSSAGESGTSSARNVQPSASEVSMV